MCHGIPGGKRDCTTDNSVFACRAAQSPQKRSFQFSVWLEECFRYERKYEVSLWESSQVVSGRRRGTAPGGRGWRTRGTRRRGNTRSKGPSDQTRDNTALKSSPTSVDDSPGYTGHRTKERKGFGCHWGPTQETDDERGVAGDEGEAEHDQPKSHAR